MKTLRTLCAAVVTAFVLTSFAVAGDPSGTWKYTFTGPNGRTIDSTLKLELKEGKLTGVVSGFRGETPISDAAFENDTVRFSVVRERDGEKRVSTYSGKVEGDEIKGTVQMPGRDGAEGRKIDWHAKRAK